jgi:hypothetical protein
MLTLKINPKNHYVVGPDGLATINVNVPMQLKFGLDMTQEMQSDEMFFNKIKEDVLPKIVDKEKIVIYPAIYYVEEESGDEKFALADEIDINMHFRRRWSYSGVNRIMIDAWLTNDTYGWTTGQTGCYEGKDYDGEDFDPTNFDERSDLVGYLGFDDDDIYYQKTKVKKSFLRLLYYDSKDMLNKNLLTYSTSFLDSGKLFTKYSMIRNNESLFKYVSESERFDNEMVMFEPGRQPIVSDRKYVTGETKKYDSLRISSGIVLKDKYNDDASSDGFYLYMFKQDAPSEEPIDLYLKAEFNNAKYGKTVNLMLPVGDDGVPIRFGDTVVDDSGNTINVFPQFFTKDVSGQTLFDFDAYYNSLFINIKCKYEKNLKKYVYYFPWDPKVQVKKMGNKPYQVSNDLENRKITLNFFEPRLNKVEVTPIN